jgi:ribosomal protein S18 acetylase RimI-like enzyme
MMGISSTGPNLTLRRATPEDVPALEAILLNTFETTWRPAISSTAAAAFLEGRGRAYVAQCGADFWVAERAGRVIGFVHWQGNFVHAVHVLAGEARGGVGTRLMGLAEAAIVQAGYNEASLETDTFNAGSRAFYEGRGYREARRYPDEEWGSGLTTILFVKSLRPR